MEFRNLRHVEEDESLVHGEALVARLERGSLSDWAPLVRAVAADPAGPVAVAVLDLCRTYPFEVPAPAYLFQQLVLDLRQAAGLPVPAFQVPPEPAYI